MDEIENLKELVAKFEPSIDEKVSEELPSYQQLYDDYQDLKQKFEEEKIKFQSDLENQKQQVNAIVSQLTQKNIENEALQSEIEMLKETNNDSQIKQLTDQLNTLQKEKLVVKEECTKLEDDSYKLLITCSKLEEQLTVAKNQEDEEIIKQKKVQQEIQDLKQQLQSAKEQEEQQTQQMKEIEQLTIQVKTENALLKTDKDVYFYKLQQLIKEIKQKKLDVNLDV